LTVKEAVAELAGATGIHADRWKRTLLESIHKRELPLRNPNNPSDNLPYPVPKQLYSFVEQVDAAGLNKLLDSHPEWGVVFRFPVPVHKPGTAEKGGSSGEAGQSDPPWIEEARRIADRIARQRFSRGEQEITARNICEAVARELEKNSDFHGERGPRTGENVRSVALRGWKFTPPIGEGGRSGSGGVG